MRKYLLRYILILFFALMLLPIVACSKNQETKLTIEAKISKVSKNEFNEINAKAFDSPTIEDFRKFTFNLDIKQSNEVTSRKIVIPSSEELVKVINTIDKVRVLNGTAGEQDNKGEKFALYKNEFVYYSKGLSNDELRKALRSKIVIVSWVTKEGKIITKKFNIGNLIKFNN
ncbi:hypothetical protein [Neobacillus sp. PS3-40]|uniref:hypothetical protein n=1 Tax=Neobacillus sp. PS3-40 TaxID=3070679 RepID=UPI0027E17558|nr:hypothetical protein [Neobacillus sp. PS3-40]WML44637.1 hypothetical protein RCG20_01615 [Neobacillus sp. PS3-40]